MDGVSEKIFLSLKMPTEDAAVSDARRILLALEVLGYQDVQIPLPVLRSLYPLCRDAGFDITVTLVHRERDHVLVKVEAGDTTRHHYGLAVDLGSTTVVMQLVDMGSGAVIGQASLVNGQTAYGTDILTRITYAMEAPDHRQQLRQATTDTLERLLDELTGETAIPAADCPVMVISGNTTMIHFLLGLDAWTVFSSPYAPVTTDPGFFPGEALGMAFPGQVYIIPAASNYIGGDIISGLLKLQLHKKEETSLFFDIGTNGELVIGNRDWMMAGAGAAGPALEGYISRFGMRAAEGAIDSVKICGGDLTFTTIGGGRPVGICGSGIIDLLAQLRLNGWIDISGQLDPQASHRIVYLPEEQEHVVYYALPEEAERPLFFSQTDILQFLDTKAAAYTMVECLLESAGVQLEELSRLYLSGAFSAHTDLESAITIGIFPDLPRHRFSVLPNTSLEGARLLLLDHARLLEAKDLAEQLYCVQFASIPDFLIRMQAAKFIPHTDMSRYPTVADNIIR